MAENVRVIRVLVYEGPADKVAEHLQRRGVKERAEWNEITIHEGWLTGRAGEVIYADVPRDIKDIRGDLNDE